jgi:2-dehydrotetronate isomerase
MPRFSANLTMMFNEWPFLDRFAAAADAGFTAVEYLFPYDHAPEEVADRLARNNLVQALFNLPPGDWAAGDRGLAALPERKDELRKSVERALVYAEATGVKRLHLMAGNADRADPAAVSAYSDAIKFAADAVGRTGRQLLLEPINPRDMPGYFLNSFAFTVDLIRELSLPNLRLQFDVYHRQILHGDVTVALRALFPLISHIQIASVPSRHEPDGEELRYDFLFDEIDRLGYDGYVGCEYRPRAHTTDGLGWFKPYASARARGRS